MNTVRSIHVLTTLAFGAVFLASCGSDEPANDSQASVVDPAVDAVFLDAKPEGAISVLEARKSAKPGDTVTISGKIAGTMNPFTEGYASFVLADRTLETCDLIPGDECPTPWDACCVEPGVIKASRLTLQIVGDDGRPVAASVKGAHGLAELAPLVVTGTVAEGSTEENLIVNLSGLFVDAVTGEQP